MDELRIAIAGLGAASALVLPAMGTVEGVRLTAGADIREPARRRFEHDFGLPAFGSVEALCDSGVADAVWIETPPQLHCAHVLAAAQRGKHVICAKPLAATLDECDQMIVACRSAGVRLLIGHSKVLDTPVQAMARIAASGRLGQVLKIDSWWFNDWLRRPRLAEELDETLGAGFVLRQAPHLVDVACLIAGSRPESVQAWLSPSPGICTTAIRFASGAIGSFTLSGCGFFESRELTWNLGVFGGESVPGKPASWNGPVTAGEKFSRPPETSNRTAAGAQPFAGLTIVSCADGVLRQSPNGLFVYTGDGRSEEPVSPSPGRAAELIELRDALRQNRDVFPNGEWGRMNLEICLAILYSARTGCPVTPGAWTSAGEML